jgi:hypothetical protein
VTTPPETVYCENDTDTGMSPGTDLIPLDEKQYYDSRECKGDVPQKDNLSTKVYGAK